MRFIRSLEYVPLNVEAYCNYYYFCPLLLRKWFFFNNLFRRIQKHTFWTENPN